MQWFDRHNDKEGNNPFRWAPEWARVLADLQTVTIIQNEMILAKLEERDSKLSPQDQAKVDEIFDIEARDKKRIDAALKPK